MAKVVIHEIEYSEIFQNEIFLAELFMIYSIYRIAGNIGGN